MSYQEPPRHHEPRRRPRTGTAITLSIFGIALIAIAVIILLKGSGIIASIPGYVMAALTVAAVGAGILGGLNVLRGR